MSKQAKRKQPSAEPNATARLLRELVEFASKHPEYWRTPITEVHPRGKFQSCMWYRLDNDDEDFVSSGYHDTLAASIADLAKRVKDFLEDGE